MGLNCTCPLTYGLFVNVFYFPYDFLNNVFFSLAYFMIRIQYIIYITYKICVNRLLSVRLPINSSLLAVTFGGEPKVIHGFSATQGSVLLARVCSRVSCN